MQNGLTKHIKITRHFIKEKPKTSLVYTSYMSTNTQLAYVLTKELSSPAF